MVGNRRKKNEHVGNICNKIRSAFFDHARSESVQLSCVKHIKLMQYGKHQSRDVASKKKNSSPDQGIKIKFIRMREEQQKLRFVVLFFFVHK